MFTDATCSKHPPGAGAWSAAEVLAVLYARTTDGALLIMTAASVAGVLAEDGASLS